MNNNSSIIVYIGDVGSYLSELARQNDANAEHISDDNFSQLQAGVYYTSIGDLSGLEIFAAILRQANTIIYAPPTRWSDQTGTLEKWTLDYLSVFACDSNKTIIGFEFPHSYLNSACKETQAGRLTDRPQIWVVGCSISHGIGVGPDQRFGAIISKKLGLPVSYLTMPSSSIAWAADQILRSDIRNQDIIFWGLTGISRLSYWNDESNKVEHCPIKVWPMHRNFLKTIIKENFFASEHLKYQCISQVRQVDNICRKIGAKLVMGTVVRGLEKYLTDLDTFLPLEGLHGRNMQIDVGSDGLHPGSKTHAFYADLMIHHYKKVYESKN